MAENSQVPEVLKGRGLWMAAGVILFAVLLMVVLGPVMNEGSPKESPLLDSAREISLGLYQYAVEHQGAFPECQSSTEVFQKLMDGGYVTDPTIFYAPILHLPGKVKASSNKLKPENVCWDITASVTTGDSDFLPIVFCTGYRMNYVPGGGAVPATQFTKDRGEGIAVTYHTLTTIYIWNDHGPDGTVSAVIDARFNAHGKQYRQLTPDGPLGP